MDNTPAEETDQLNTAVRHSPMSSFLFANAMSGMWAGIGRAASACAVAGSGKHRFSGYPRESARCRSCGIPLFRM